MKTELSTPPSWVAPLTDYLAWERAAKRPQGTVKLRRYHVRRFAHFAGCAPDEVTLSHIVNFMGTEGWSPAYARSVRTSLRSFFLWAYRRNLTPTNPAEEAPQVSVPIGISRPASDHAVELVARARDPRVPLMARFGNECGMRCCEIAVVHPSDVRGSRKSYELLVHGKGRKERIVPISDAFAALILSYDGYLFPGQIDGHLSAGRVSRLLSLGMGDTDTGHQLRHRAGNRWLLTSGGNLRTVQELLGHASLATTQIYTRVTDQQLRDTALAA